MVSDEVVSAITAWSPNGVGPAAAGFARATVAAAGPQSPTRARALLGAAAKLAAWAHTVGLEPSAGVLFSTPVIERFMASGAAGLAAPTRRTLRSNLRHLQRALLPGPAPARLARERAKAPYSEADMAAFLALADAQPTLARRMRAQALLALGAGAGLVGADLRGVRGSDVMNRWGGLVVVVGGRRPRTVPVLSTYHQRLVASAGFAGDAFLIGGTAPGRKNVTTPLVASLAGGSDLARLEIGRLRSTWLAAVASALGLGAFMAAAGIRCSQRLGDIVATLPELDEHEAVRLLGGAS